MRNFSNTVAVKERDHRVVATTNDDWRHVRLGSSIRFGDEKIWYEIGNVKKDLYVKEFTIKNNKVKIANNDDLNFLPNDSVKITYKEYAIYTIVKILAPGNTFYAGESVNVLGGEPSVDNVNGVSLGAKIRVDEVDYQGGIVKASILNEGKYIRTPNDVAEINGRSGKSAMLKLEYKILEKRVLLNRTITRIEDVGARTVLYFDYNLPKISSGKISAEKWHMMLVNPYRGDTGLTNGYEILKDFAPNSNFALLDAGSTNPEQVINLDLKRIADRFSKVEKRIEWLEKKIRLGN